MTNSVEITFDVLSDFVQSKIDEYKLDTWGFYADKITNAGNGFAIKVLKDADFANAIKQTFTSSNIRGKRGQTTIISSSPFQMLPSHWN